MSNKLFYNDIGIEKSDISNMLNDQEFELYDGRITLSISDRVSIETDQIKILLNVVEFGTVFNNLSLCIFYNIDDDADTIYFLSIFEFAYILGNQNTLVQLVLPEEFDKYFYDRPYNLVKPICMLKLKEAMLKLNGIKIRGGKSNKKLFELSETQIGSPDWTVKFKVNTTNWGMTSLAKIASVVHDHNDELFLMCHNHRGSETYVNSSTMFFSLSGINISPDKVTEKLLGFDTK